MLVFDAGPRGGGDSAGTPWSSSPMMSTTANSITKSLVAEEKSRKEKRKEARLAKQRNRFLSWVHYQGSKKKKKAPLDLKPQSEDVAVEKKSKKKSDDLKKRKMSSEGKSKTKFQKFLEMEMGKGMVSAEEDLEMERRLAKKLKVKNGNLGGPDDELNMLLSVIPSALDSMVGSDTDIDDEVEEDCGNIIESVSTDKKKRKRKKSSVSLPKQLEEEFAVEVSMGHTEVESSEADQLDTSGKKEPCVEETVMDMSVKYVAPHLRARANVESEELSQVRRRVRGLLNRLSESNVESITEEVAAIFRFLAVLVVK